MQQQALVESVSTPLPNGVVPGPGALRCGVPTCELSFCAAAYPIVLDSSAQLQYTDAQARFFYESEYARRPGSVQYLPV